MTEVTRTKSPEWVALQAALAKFGELKPGHAYNIPPAAAPAAPAAPAVK